MNQTLLAVGSVGASIGVYFLNRRLKNKTIKIGKKEFVADVTLRKILSVLLFLIYMPHLFTLEVISDQIGLSGGFYSPVALVFLMLLKWLTYFGTAVCILLPFFNNQRAKDFATFIVPVTMLLNFIFFKQIVVSILGRVDYYHWKIIIYAVITALVTAISGEKLIEFFVEKDFKDKQLPKRFGKLGIYFLVYLFAYMPVYAPQLLFGYAGDTPAGFTVVHRLLIYFCFLFPFAAYFGFRNKSYEEKRYFLMMLALSGFLQYFYFNAHRSGLNSFPLHLCNTAIALMFFAYAFNLKGVFYFTYLVNVMGALCAIILPNCEDEVTRMGNMIFWYNHVYAFVLPVLGVALKVFERPNMKLMRKAIIAFTCYVVVAATLNAWLNNSPINKDHVEIDYFFLYSDFFVNKFAWALPIKYNFVLRFRLGDTMMTYYYMYILTIYVIFIGLMFVAWGAYGLTYRTGDAHKELARRKKLMRVDKLNLLKELDGRSIKEPMHPEGVNMIKIIDFSKTYAGSDKKAVDGLNLEVHAGEVFGFIGHNGAGKSTTIKSLVGIQTITDGRIEIEGYDIARQPLEAKLNIGYVSDNHAVYEKLTGREYIGYVADLYMVNEKDKNERIEKYVKMFNLEDAIDREIKSYSHGMKQKIMVISALIHNPKVWVLDEPLTGLDPTSAYQIKECMRQHADAGNIVFFSSHVIEVVEKICDRVAIISGGKLRKVCTPEELKEDGVSLEQIYLKYATQNVDEESKTPGETAVSEAAAVQE